MPATKKIIRRLIIWGIVVSGILHQGIASSAQAKLELISAVPIEGPENLNPSGLAYCGGEVLLVSDKFDHTVYALDVNEDRAILKPKIYDLNIPKNSYTGLSWLLKLKLFIASLLKTNIADWEGIACDSSGELYLISETFADIAKVSPTGNAIWLNTDLLTAGKKQGLFRIPNAYLEGITLLDPNTILVAAEREPRGLIRLRQNNSQWKPEFIADRESPILPPHPRVSDFSGLATLGDVVYTLERNASAVCARNIEELSVIECWSYAEIEESPQYRYHDNTYGLAEGIILTDKHLLIVFDNNGDYRANDINDRQSQLFIFKKPDLHNLYK